MDLVCAHVLHIILTHDCAKYVADSAFTVTVDTADDRRPEDFFSGLLHVVRHPLNDQPAKLLIVKHGQKMVFDNPACMIELPIWAVLRHPVGHIGVNHIGEVVLKDRRLTGGIDCGVYLGHLDNILQKIRRPQPFPRAIRL